MTVVNLKNNNEYTIFNKHCFETIQQFDCHFQQNKIDNCKS